MDPHQPYNVDHAHEAQEGTPPPRLSWPFALVIFGVIAILATSLLEQEWIKQQPMGTALIVVGEAPAETMPPEVIPLRAVTIDAPGPIADSDSMQMLEASMEAEEISYTFNTPEPLLLLETPVAFFEPLLVSGRLPEAGKAEVLAGDGARPGPFTVGDTTFTVVGQIAQGFSGGFFCYFMSDDPAWKDLAQEEDTQPGWLHPAGLESIETLLAKPDTEDAAAPKRQIHAGQRSLAGFGYTTLAGLILIAVGGGFAYVRLLTRWPQHDLPGFSPVLHELAFRPKLLFWTHIAMYGVFFGSMLWGMQYPLYNHLITSYLQNTFSEGNLAYIGEAYASGNILRAAGATFMNNYVLQTLVLTFGISLFIPLIGVLKTMLSLLFTGFAMAPIWAGTADAYWFHSITMVLELEAYFFACFVVLACTGRLVVGLRYQTFHKEFRAARNIFFSGIFLTAAMLLLAALYEAATLILLA